MIYSLDITSELIFQILRILLSVSLFFVWVVRYDNIVKEFKNDYNIKSFPVAWNLCLFGCIDRMYGSEVDAS